MTANIGGGPIAITARAEVWMQHRQARWWSWYHLRVLLHWQSWYYARDDYAVGKHIGDVVIDRIMH
ncbi:MAG: hypothetical protein V8S23_05285 [Lachnospiraceae bacterium]